MTIDEGRKKITDRYGNELKKADSKPNLVQSLYAWDLLNELIELGYTHNWQSTEEKTRQETIDYLYNVSAILDKAIKIKGNKEVINA